MTMKKAELPAAIKAAAQRMAAEQSGGCCYWHLGRFDNKNWVICIGWQDGFEPSDDPNDSFASHDANKMGLDAHLCIKLAYQPANMVTLQCDYDMDWLMPFDETTGEVNDTEEMIFEDSNYQEIVDILCKEYERLRKEYSERKVVYI